MEDEHGQRDKDVVRQAGGLGGDCPACRVFGLNTEQHKTQFHFCLIFFIYSRKQR